MITEPFALALKIVSGGAVGYITNLLAIKMLFRKYPLIGGGVILITYKDLKINLSELVERDLINHRTLQKELNKEEFRKNFYDLISYFIYDSLHINIPDSIFQDLPGGQETINNIHSFLSENSNTLVKNPNINLLLDRLKVSDLVGSEHMEHFINELYLFSHNFFSENGEKFEEYISEDIKNLKISDLIAEKTYDKLTNNLLNATKDINISLRKHDKSIDKIIDYVYESLEINGILRQLEEELKKKKIVEIIGLERRENVHREIIKKTLSLVNSDEGKSIITSVSKNIIDLGIKIDRPIFSFLNPALQVNLFLFLEENLPHLAKTSSEWLRKNKKQIEDLVEESINEYYSSQDIWGQIKLTIKEVIGLKIAENFQVVEKGIESLEKYIDKKASADFTQEVINFLEIKKLGSFIEELKINEVLVAEFFVILLNKYLPNAKLNFVDTLLDRNINDVLKELKVNYQGYYSDYIRNFLLKTLKQNYLYSDNFKNDFQKQAREKSREYYSRELFSGIKKEHITKSRQTLFDYFTKSEATLKKFIINKVYPAISEKSFLSLKNSELLRFFQEAPDLYEKGLNKLSIYLKNSNLKKIYDSFINKNKNITEPVNSFVFTNLINNLENAMNGRISGSVGKKLESLSPEQLRDKVEDFMGRELKPITILGAILGAISGLLLYLFQDSILPPSSDYAIFFLIPVTYALVGIGTNWIALRMLFKPYKKIFIGKLGLPFTPGVVASRKAFFAKNMGDFVSKHLITEDTIHNTFNENFRSEIIRIISEKNYSKIDEVLNKNKEAISQKITIASSDFIKGKLIDEKEVMIKKLLDTISGYNFNKFYSQAMGFVSKTENLNFIKKPVRDKISENKDKKLKNLIIPFYSEIKLKFISVLENKINEILDLVGNDDDFNEKILERLDSLDYLMETSLKDILADDVQQRFITKASEVLNEIIKVKLEVGIQKYIEEHFVKEELSPDKEIKDLFNGELINFIKKNTVIIIDSLMFELGLEKLKAEKKNISDAIIKGVRAHFQDNIFYGLSESVLNIETDIKEIVHLIIDKNLEPFLQEKKSELETILLSYIDFISEKKLKEIGFTENILNTGNINNVLDNLLNSEKITASTEIISKYLIENILKFKIKDILELLGINTLREAYFVFENEITLLRKFLSETIAGNKENIVRKASELVTKILEEEILELEINELLENIPESEFDENIEKIVNKIISTVSWEKIISLFLTQTLEHENLFRIIKPELLKNDFSTLFDKVFHGEEFQQTITDIINGLVVEFLPEFNNIADTQTKDFLLKVFTDTLLQSLEKKAITLFHSVNISEVVEKEINNMHPKEIEELFNSFAKPYFKKLILYGWLGGIIGLADAAITALQ